jgi:hypothetical protein
VGRATWDGRRVRIDLGWVHRNGRKGSALWDSAELQGREFGVRVSHGGAVRKETGSQKLGVAAACLYVGNSGCSRGWEEVLEAV